MIPKVIHYCWFGGTPLPELAERCIDSWKRKCPDYELKRWDESNFTLDVPYVKEAYRAKKWAFVSDYARLKIIYDNGGIYLDTDVELLQPLDILLEDKCFMGAETDGFVATGLGFGAEKHHKVIKALLDVYRGRHFEVSRGIYDLTSCPRLNTPVLLRMGYVFSTSEVWMRDDITIYPPDYFCPMDYKSGETVITDQTVSIHHFSASWVTNQNAEIDKVMKEARKKYRGLKFLIETQKEKFRIAQKYEGFTHYYQYVDNRIRKKIVYKLKGW